MNGSFRYVFEQKNGNMLYPPMGGIGCYNKNILLWATEEEEGETKTRTNAKILPKKPFNNFI